MDTRTKPRARGILLPLLLQLWEFKLTPMGKVMVVCLCFLAAAASASLDIPVYQLGMGFGMVWLVDLVAGWIVAPRLEVQWRLPERAIAGQSLEIACTVVNRGRTWARDLAAGAFQLPSSLLPGIAHPFSAIAPGKSGELALSIVPLKRGVYPAPDLRVFSVFPFLMFRTRARRAGKATPPRGSLVVYPHFHRLHALDVPMNARYQPGGVALSSSVGESPEYIGNREYRAGDALRHLDARSWARLGTPVVREYQEEFYCRVALVLDTFIGKNKRTGPKGDAQLEAAVSLCAAIADSLAQTEYIMDLFAAGPELHVFRAGRHTAHFENVLEILAGVGECRSNPFAKITPALTGELMSTSSVICVFLDWDADRARLVRAATEAGCSVKAIVVRAADTTLPQGLGDTYAPFIRYAPETIAAGRVEVV